MRRCDILHDHWVVIQLGWFPSQWVHSWCIWGRPDLTVTAHLDVPHGYRFIIKHYEWYCGVSLSECMCRTLISRMHMTVNRMWLHEHSKTSGHRIWSITHGLYDRYTHVQHTMTWFLARYVQVVWAEESSFAVLVYKTSDPNVGSDGSQASIYKYPQKSLLPCGNPYYPYSSSHCSGRSRSSLCLCCHHRDQRGDFSWFMSYIWIRSSNHFNVIKTASRHVLHRGSTTTI